MSRTRILAVDDDERILRQLKRAGEGAGYEVHCVRDAEFFQSSFRVFEPSLVFLDLNMRTIDGVELLRFIAGEGAQTSIIVASGADGHLLANAHSLGVSLGLDMLVPIRKPSVVADVRQRLQSFHARPAHDTSVAISEEELDEAIARGRVDVFYQPMLTLDDRRLVCVEALARLRRPGSGISMPSQFIALAERCGLIDGLTFCVLERSIADLASWAEVGPGLQVAVNMSPRLLCDPSLPERVETLLRKYRVAPDRLVLEVTETSVPDDREGMVKTLSRLRHKGIRLALDDFGTGFCSLGQVYEFPYETLKLDKKFAMHAATSQEAAAMVRSSLELARSVGMSVVAEGIQSEDTLRWLQRLGCDVGQGFHISPPLPANALRDWLERPGASSRLCGAPLSLSALSAA